MEMRPKTRLSWTAVIILVSVAYAAVVAMNPDVAQALMLGYVSVLLTIFAVNEVWRKP